jgi:hypothetical protein
MNFKQHWWKTALVVGLVACGGSESGKKEVENVQPNTSFFQFKADVTGLVGNLVLSNNGENSVTLTENGLIALPSTWSNQGNYEIKVLEEPCLQRCEIDEPTGTVPTVGSRTLKINCESKRWDIPSSETDAMSIVYSDAEFPTLAMNRYGDTILSWYQSDNFNQHLFKREFFNRKWNSLSSIVEHFSFDGSNATGVAIALNDNLDASVVWKQTATDDFGSIYLGEKTDSAWTYSPNMFNVASQSSGSKPVVRMNASGDKIVVWSQSVGSSTKLFKSEYRNGVWTHANDISDRISIDGSDVEAFDAAINDLGEIVITWNQSNGTDLQIYKAVYRNGGWDFPTSLSNNVSPSGTDSESPRISMNNQGDVYIAWYQKDAATGGKFQIFILESHDSGLTWDAPNGLSDNLSPNGRTASYPKVVVNDSGKVVINYRLQNANDIYQSYALVRANSTSSWSNVRLTDADFSEDQGYQAVDMDEYGNVVAAWSSNGSGKVYKAEYRNGAWQLAQQSSPINLYSSDYNLPAVAVNNCRSTIAWQQEGVLGQKQIFIQQYR